MIFGRSTYPGEASTAPRELSPQDIQTRDNTHREIRSLYEAGTPLFTRANIVDVVEQLRNLNGKSGTVLIKSLEGKLVDFSIETGRVLPYGADTEQIIGTPLIYYCSYQELTSNGRYPISRIAYCNLRIHHYIDVRHKLTHQLMDMMGRPMCDNESLEASRQILQAGKTKWEQSEKSRQIHSVLQALNFSVKIQTIVSFAFGSIRHDSEYIPRSSCQHALVLTLQKLLCEKQKESGSISCYAQDPEYTKIDKAILQENGIEVLDDPDGFLAVDESTFVVSFAPDVPVKQIILDLVRPAAMIWNRIAEKEDSRVQFSDPVTSRIWEIIQKYYHCIEIPGNVDNFGDVALYVRRGSAAYTPANNYGREGKSADFATGRR